MSVGLKGGILAVIRLPASKKERVSGCLRAFGVCVGRCAPSLGSRLVRLVAAPHLFWGRLELRLPFVIDYKMWLVSITDEWLI